MTTRTRLRRDIVVVGASAGGIQVLAELLGGLSPDFPAAVFIVQHLMRDRPSRLADFLARVSALPVAAARNGMEIRRGRAYVAPADRHLLLQRGTMRLWAGPPEEFFRPAINPLFRSAAAAYGRRVIGVVLSGMLCDGAEGLRAIKQEGGIALVQSPADAAYPDMPLAALRRVQVDACLPHGRMAAELVRLAAAPRPSSLRPGGAASNKAGGLR